MSKEQRTGRPEPSFTHYALVAVLSVGLGIAAVPERPAEPAHLEGAAVAQRVQSTVEEFRAAILHYAFHHNTTPGYPPRAPGEVRGAASEAFVRSQLCERSDSQGSTHDRNPLSRTFGPYMRDGMLANPLNGSDAVRLLASHEGFPAEPDGATGWMYKPSTGEVRVNAVGFVPGTNIRYYDL
jgi:hypothetical protein